MLLWLAAILFGKTKISARHLNQRGDLSLGGLTRMVTALLMVRALHIHPVPRRQVPRWRHGRDLHRSHFRRSLLGAKLRRALTNEDIPTSIAKLISVLRNLDAYAARLAYRIRRMRRYFLRTTPSIEPSRQLLGAPAPPPAFANSS